MKVYYNDNDPGACAWLRELIKAGLIPPGDVDERSITDVQGSDVAGYEQCHWFAGIGGWAYALQLAGWDGPVWTASCPCQPWSEIGEGRGENDPRHLWPSLARLIRQQRPAKVFGEQVASKAALRWLDGVFADLEAEGYACGAIDISAASVGAPHIRQRLYWVAESQGEQFSRTTERRFDLEEVRAAGAVTGASTGRGRCARGMEYAPRNGRQQRRSQPDGGGIMPTSSFGGVADPDESGEHRRASGGEQPLRDIVREPRLWDAYDSIPCADGKTRRIEPGSFPLAHGIPARVGRLRGYGNAIVPQVAAAFISAYMDTLAERGAP